MAGAVASARPVRLHGTGGLSLRGQQIGSGSTVLLLHGGGQTGGAWSATARRLAEAGFAAWSMDLRGHGESGWAPDQDYRLATFGADTVEMVRQLPAPVYLVGASLGGLSSVLAAAELPADLIAGLVLVDVTLQVNRTGAKRILGFMLARPEGFASLEEAAAAVAAYQPHRTRPTSTEGLRRNLRRGVDGRWRWHWDPSFVSGPTTLNTRAHRSELEAAARKVAQPVLLVRGSCSDVVDDAGVDHLMSHRADLRVTVVPDAGHMVAGDANDRFSAAVLEFLREIEAARRG